MENIWFYDFSFTPVLVLPKVISVNWQLYFNSVGTFELHTSLQDKLTGILKKHPYLVAVQGDKQAVVTGCRLGEDCAVYGRSCNWLLEKRIVTPFETKKARADMLCKAILEEGFYDIEELVLKEDAALEEISFSLSEDTTVKEAVQDLLKQKNYGHRLFFDYKNKQWVFEILKGKNLTFVIAEDNKNACNTEYVEDVLSLCTGGWYYEEQEEDEEGNPQEPVRTYLSCDETKTGMMRWDAILSAKKPEDASIELTKKQKNNSVKTMVKHLYFGQDYSLGDKMQVKVACGEFEKTEDLYVAGVRIWYEAEESGEEPTFEEYNKEEE